MYNNYNTTPFRHYTLVARLNKVLYTGYDSAIVEFHLLVIHPGDTVCKALLIVPVPHRVPEPIARPEFGRVIVGPGS